MNHFFGSLLLVAGLIVIHWLGEIARWLAE